MTDAQIEKVIGAVASVRRIPREQISLDSELTVLGFDSLDTTVLLFELEKQFGISISDDEVRSVRNVQDVVDGIQRILDKTNSEVASSETKE